MTTHTALDMPELAGSEKQVTWAASIREEQLAQALRAIDEQAALLAREEGLSAEELARMVAQARAMVQEVLSTRTRAAWWIERRVYGPLHTFELA